MTTIRISDEVEEYIKRRGKFGDTHDDVLRRFLIDFDPIDESTKIKQELLEMARNGDEKPVKHKTTLRKALDSYFLASSGLYDPVFENKIRKLRPDWFE